MAQNPTVCGVSILICRVRATLLDTDGEVHVGPNNSYVTDNPIRVTLTPVIESGKDSTLKGGCDCIVADYRGPDLLKRFDFEFDIATVEPALYSLMLGSTLISDTSTSPVPIGNWWPAQVGCSKTPPPPIAFEFWSQVWDGQAQNASWPYIHHVYPYTLWQIGAQTYEDDFAQPKLTGFSRTNAQWGHGPYGDQPDPTPIDSPGGQFYTATALPTAVCGYKTVAVSS